MCDNEFDIARNKRNICIFSLNIVVDVFRNLDPINMPYGTVCMDRRITFAYSSSIHFKFTYTETEVAFLFPTCRIPFNNLSEGHRLKHEDSTLCKVGSHFDPPNKRPV